MSAETFVHLAAPTLDVEIKIDGIGIGSASIELKGGAGLTWKFAAGSDVGMRANVNALLQPDTDFSILSALNIKYRFKGEGGLEPSTPLTILNKTNPIGGCKLDEDTSATGHLSGPV